MSNIVIANFQNATALITDPIWQWNYGQILRIQGLSLPRAVEVHFASGDTSITRIGNTTDGVTDVAIPDSLLETSGRLNAYVYLHTGDDDGETEYEITVPVKARAEPEAYDSEEEYTALTQAIALLENDLEQTGEDKSAAEQAKNDATQAKNDAVEAKDAAKEYAESANESKKAAVQAKESADEILEKIQDAKEAVEDRIAEADKAAEDLEDTIGAIGLYIDEDGDICQQEV